MNRKEKLHIAKEAYRIMSTAVRYSESYMNAKVNCLWPGYICVDKTMFEPDELRDDDQGD